MTAASHSARAISPNYSMWIVVPIESEGGAGGGPRAGTIFFPSRGVPFICRCFVPPPAPAQKVRFSAAANLYSALTVTSLSRSRMTHVHTGHRRAGPQHSRARGGTLTHTYSCMRCTPDEDLNGTMHAGARSRASAQRPPTNVSVAGCVPSLPLPPPPPPVPAACRAIIRATGYR